MMPLCSCQWEVMCFHKSQAYKERVWSAELPHTHMRVAQCKPRHFKAELFVLCTLLCSNTEHKWRREEKKTEVKQNDKNNEINICSRNREIILTPAFTFFYYHPFGQSHPKGQTENHTAD